MKMLLIGLLASLNVISFNIRIGTCDDGDNSWDIRKPATIAMIRVEKPDIIGLQETVDFQEWYIRENCSAYEAIGDCPNSVFYRKASLKCLKWGKFWLSETPDKASQGWDGAYPRTAVWALMCDKKSHKSFYFVNTHLDHIGVTAREKGLALILERMAAINKEGLPLVLCGDFNCEAGNPELGVIRGKMDNTRLTARKTDAQTSYNGWGKASSSIDFIFQKGFSSCRSFKTITKEFAGKRYISDHYPVKAQLVF